MNKIQKIFSSISDADLKKIVLDLKEQDETGILPDGAARQLVKRICHETGISHKDAYNTVQSEPMRRAAYKWAELP